MSKPFLKWADSKTELVPRIWDELRPIVETYRCQRLIEPFAGSCAVALSSPLENFLVADTNQDLIELYRWLKRVSPDFIADCQTLFEQAHNRDESESFYYGCRQLFNDTPRGDYWRGVLFVYLNRHGYNGLCTYDESGEFNVPYGMYRKPYFPAAELSAFQQWSQWADFVHADFRTTMDGAMPGDVLYCDPPNLSLTTIDGLATPMPKEFTVQDHMDLSTKAQELADRGIPVIISSLDTAEAREIYSQAKIDTFPVRRYIRDKGGARGKVWEIVAVYNTV